MTSILLDQVPQLRREVNRAKIVVSQTATASFKLSIPEPGTSDHIRPFFWVPSDVTEEQLPRIVEKNIALCWLQLANPKNGGWKPVVQPKGWSYDKVESLWKWNKGTKLNITVMHVVFPPDHPHYKEGSDTYLIRYPDHSLIRWRSDKPSGGPIHLSDDIAASMQAKGLFKVQEWDTPDGKNKLEEIEYNNQSDEEESESR